MGGYDFLISYDASALHIAGVIPGPDWFDNTVDEIGCEWEYFTHRLSPFGDCGNACASGKVRVLAIAETNVCCHNVNCLVPDSFPSVLFTIDFLVSDNRTYECQFLPLQFVWSDCGDNGIVNEAGNKLYISREVYGYDSPENIADSIGTYPTWNGTQACTNSPSSNPLIRRIDFYSGGIDVSCPGIFDVPGDINLNEISNEIADGVLFSDYFLYGLSVFTVNVEEQKAATDMNADEILLSLADLVYLQRVIVGDASPYPKTSPPVMDASYTIANGKISIDSTVAAAAIVVAGNVTPKLLAPNMDMRCAFDGTNTHILVYTDITNSTTLESFTGSFIAVNSPVVSIEFATPLGGMVETTQAAGGLQDFILGQNYPNPFNQTTRISFSLPQAADYSLIIYNIAGQKVFESHGRGVAGINAVEWTATQEASGIYFYKLTSGNISETKKMIFLK